MLRRKFLYGSALLPFIGEAGARPGTEAGKSASFYNILNYGASSGGTRKNTAAIQSAIDTCAEAGGGVVYVPAGRYLTGAINLRNEVTLYLESGSVLLGSGDPTDYPLRANPWLDRRRQISSLIYGEGLENVALVGRGTIDGQGHVWWNRQGLATPKATIPVIHTDNDQEEIRKIKYGRPRLITLVRCRNVLVDGLTLTNSAAWTLNPVFSEDVMITGLRIVNPANSPNTDGIDPESCRNVHISDCTIDVGDDCIAIKSGIDEIGRKFGKPCENIIINNLITVNGHAGVAIGSDMSGGVRNVAISNCTFLGTKRGFRIKSQRGRGGVVEGVVASNISMHGVPEAISITTFYGGKRGVAMQEPVSEGTPQFRHIYLSNITALGSRSAGEILGLKEMPLTDISLEQVMIGADVGMECQNLRNLNLRGIQIDCRKGPSLTGQSIVGLEFDGFRTSKSQEDTPVADLSAVEQVFVRGCFMRKLAGPFILVRGAGSSHIVAVGNDFPAGREAFTFQDGASSNILVEK